MEIIPDLSAQAGESGFCRYFIGLSTTLFDFHRAGLDYVSCSPFRIPIARLAAAQAVLENRPG